MFGRPPCLSLNLADSTERVGPKILGRTKSSPPGGVNTGRDGDVVGRGLEGMITEKWQLKGGLGLVEHLLCARHR